MDYQIRVIHHGVGGWLRGKEGEGIAVTHHDTYDQEHLRVADRELETVVNDATHAYLARTRGVRSSMIDVRLSLYPAPGGMHLPASLTTSLPKVEKCIYNYLMWLFLLTVILDTPR